MKNLNRYQAAAWVGVSEAAIRRWESIELLPRQRPGFRRPASYGLSELTRLMLVTRLSAARLPLPRMRKALDTLQRHVPEPLLVSSTGDVIPLSNRDVVHTAIMHFGYFVSLDPVHLRNEAKKLLEQVSSS